MDNIKARIAILEKIAKKQSIPPLSGKISRKELEKRLQSVRQIYDLNYKELLQAKNEAARIDAIIEDRRAKSDFARNEMDRLYELLKTMDLAGNINNIKVDNDDVAFMKDNKWFHFAPDDRSLIPWRQHKRDQAAADDFLDESSMPDEGFDVVKE